MRNNDNCNDIDYCSECQKAMPMGMVTCSITCHQDRWDRLESEAITKDIEHD